MMLADFRDAREAARWSAVDDVVMGGRSKSAMLTGQAVGIFTGEVSLEQGGGFASVRRQQQVVDLSACDTLELRLKGDGRRYKMNLRCSGAFDGVVFQATFQTSPSAWLTAELLLGHFAPRFRGRPARGTLDRAHVSSLGLLISDGQAGPFRLELESIAAKTRSSAAPNPTSF